MVAVDLVRLAPPKTLPPPPPRPFSLSATNRRALFAVLAVLLLVRLLGMWWLPLVDTTEARYAEIARKMVETGDWITPQFDYGVPFWGKPPLHSWLSALGMKIFGVNAFGARALIMVAALAVLALIFDWVRRNKGSDQALLATVVLASSALFFGASAFVMTDMVMVLGTVLCMVGFHSRLTSPTASRIWGYLFFTGIAIGLLAKGPVALVMTAMPLLVWLGLGRRWHQLSRLPWRSGLLLAAILTLPWYIAAEIKTPGFLRYFLIGEHFERYIVPGWSGDLYGSGHARPKGMIWPDALVMFLPWTLFVPALFLRSRSVLAAFSGDDRGWHSYLLLWLLSPLVMFTPAANILAAYVLPGLPAAAVLLVSLWALVWGVPGVWARRSAALAISAVGLIFLGISLLSITSPQSLHLKTERDLVAAARQADPGINLTYWGPRSFSAQFYTGGTAVFTTSRAAVNALAVNGARDALAVHEDDLAGLAPLIPPAFQPVGPFGRRVLFIETSPEGATP